MSAPEVTNVVFQGAPEELGRTGLLGYVTFTLNDLVHIKRVALRRSDRGSLVLRYPKRRLLCGHQVEYVVPVDDEVRRAIELQVLALLSTEVST